MLLKEALDTKPSKQTKISALIALLRAEALESIDVRAGALVWYKKALELDVTCYDAWKRLNEGCMLSPDEEEHFLNSLPFTSDLEWLKALYVSRTSKFIASYGLESTSGAAAEALKANELLAASNSATSSVTSVSRTGADSSMRLATLSKPNLPVPGKKTAAGAKDVFETDLSAKPSTSGVKVPSKYGIVGDLDTKFRLKSNEDVIAAKAQAAFYANRVRDAFSLTSSVLERDPYCSAALMIHLPCLLELGMKNELYLLAHRMAENAPKSALSWYAVGCYYYLIQSWQNARLYFGKATSLKREFGAAWMAYGYTSAQNGDHDQALSAYRTAARILVGSHLPNLAIAVELTRAKDMVLAKQFALNSVSMQPRDPYPIHELAVILYRNTEYQQSIKQFELVLDVVGKSQIDATWEPTIFNLAQAYIKVSNYEKAVELLEWSLALLPYNPSSYALLAFAHHVQGRLQEAIEYYHQSLSITPEYDFALVAIEEALNEWVLRQPVEQVESTEDIEGPLTPARPSHNSEPLAREHPERSDFSEDLGAEYSMEESQGELTPIIVKTKSHLSQDLSMDLETDDLMNQSVMLDSSQPLDSSIVSIGMDLESGSDDDQMLMTPTK